MALQPMSVYKLLPKKNCKECGVATCLAFAMKFAEGKVELVLCPYLSEEAKASLGAESGPPVAEIVFGYEAAPVKLGGETVLYRHEKRFVNPTAIGIEINAAMVESEIDRRLELTRQSLSRTGQNLKLSFIALNADEEQGAAFFTILEKANHLQIPLLLNAPLELLEPAFVSLSGQPLVKVPSRGPEAVLDLAAGKGCPVLLGGNTLVELTEATQLAQSKGVKQFILNPTSSFLSNRLSIMVASRRAAVLARDSYLGFPLAWWEQESDTELAASLAIMRYASVLVLRDADLARIVPMLVLVQEIYSDPQKPISITPGVYTVGNPGPKSPVLVTTNFSLTYFLVTGDAEASGVSCHVVLVEVEGQSVLTAYASGKLTAEKIASTLYEFKMEDRVSHKRLIIPGLVSRMSGKLEDASGWQVDVGPQDSGRLPVFLRNYMVEAGLSD